MEIFMFVFWSVATFVWINQMPDRSRREDAFVSAPTLEHETTLCSGGLAVLLGLVWMLFH